MGDQNTYECTAAGTEISLPCDVCVCVCPLISGPSLVIPDAWFSFSTSAQLLFLNVMSD